MDLISKVNKKCKYLIDESKKLHQEKKVLKIMRSEIEKELKVQKSKNETIENEKTELMVKYQMN